MTDDLRKCRRGSGSGEIDVAQRRDQRRVGWAALRDGGKVSARRGRAVAVHHHRAVMSTVAPATQGEIRLRPLGQRESGQDQRKAEDQQQHEAEETPHDSSIAEHRYRSAEPAGIGLSIAGRLASSVALERITGHSRSQIDFH